MIPRRLRNAIGSLIDRPRLHEHVAAEPLAKFDACEFLGENRVGYRSYANLSLLRNCDIGRYCSIGRRCSIGAAKHPVDTISTHPMGFPPGYEGAPRTTIGNDVWIGDNAVVIAGISIGDGAIVGGGAVVTRDVAPYTIVVGIPAVVLRPRFDAETVARLQASRWWVYGDAGIDASRAVEATLARIARERPPVFSPGFGPLLQT